MNSGNIGNSGRTPLPNTAIGTHQSDQKVPTISEPPSMPKRLESVPIE